MDERPHRRQHGNPYQMGAEGALEAAAGGVNAPVGAVLGSTAGSEIGQDVYDDPKAYFDQKAADLGAPKGAVADYVDDNLRRMQNTSRWVQRRNSDLVRR